MLAITIAVALVVGLALVVLRSRRRETRERRRFAALADLAEVMRDLSDQLREAPAPPVAANPPLSVSAPGARATLVGGLPGRTALLDSLAEQVAAAHISGTRLVLVILSIDRVGPDDARIDAAAHALARLSDEPVHRVGDSSVALVLAKRGRAEALALIARAEAELRERAPGAAAVIAHSVAVELEPGDDAVAMLARASSGG